MITAQKLLELHGYAGKEMLMNLPTGSIDTAENWASEHKNWPVPLFDENGDEIEDEEERDRMITEDFGSLAHVEKDKNGDWKEV